MDKYAPEKMELAPRDIVARAIATEVKEGRGVEGQYVHLDLTHLGKEKIMKRLPGIREISIHFAGVDPIEQPIPVKPGQHYSMGGIHCNKNGETSLSGLYAVGENSCMSVHGANRLGGNSLLETLVFGRVVGQSVAAYAKGAAEPNPSCVDQEAYRVRQRLQKLLLKESGNSVSEIREAMGRTMDKLVGVYRVQEELEDALRKIRELKERFKDVEVGHGDKRYNFALIRALELENMLDLAEVITMGAIMRRESRGAHWRTDFPTRDDDQFLKHSIFTLVDDWIKAEYIDVNLGEFEVKERTY
jgi:succinate dehydrogenase/fumarate reductase flavoprotein subunit